jgi:hypothetical protein
MIALFTAATAHPCHIFLPTNIVEITVSTHEMQSSRNIGILRIINCIFCGHWPKGQV